MFKSMNRTMAIVQVFASVVIYGCLCALLWSRGTEVWVTGVLILILMLWLAGFALGVSLRSVRAEATEQATVIQP